MKVIHRAANVMRTYVNRFAFCFRQFSKDYATGCGFVLGAITLIFLYRDYSMKYRPYVVAGVDTQEVTGPKAFNVIIRPTNVGSYPCFVKITNIKLRIGDDEYPTPNIEWLLLGPHGVQVQVPVGYVNQEGVNKIREGGYKTNRIEACFDYETKSTEERFYSKTHTCSEINVAGDKPEVWQQTKSP